MIFQHTLGMVLDGTKTQTRRIVKDHQPIPSAYDGNDVFQVETFKNKVIYRIGSTYAVQGGRGQKGIARIRITDIRNEDVRNISDADVKSEGFASKEEFLTVWRSMHNDNYNAWAITFELVGGAK
jgi:hypothetical protein